MGKASCTQGEEACSQGERLATLEDDHSPGTATCAHGGQLVSVEDNLYLQRAASAWRGSVGFRETNMFLEGQLVPREDNLDLRRTTCAQKGYLLLWRVPCVHRKQLKPMEGVFAWGCWVVPEVELYLRRLGCIWWGHLVPRESNLYLEWVSLPGEIDLCLPRVTQAQGGWLLWESNLCLGRATRFWKGCCPEGATSTRRGQLRPRESKLLTGRSLVPRENDVWLGKAMCA